jgi:hypothetical protein
MAVWAETYGRDSAFFMSISDSDKVPKRNKDLPYLLHAQPTPTLQVLLSEMQESPQGLLLAGLQYLQQAPATDGLVGAMTMGGLVGMMMRVGAGAFVGARVAILTAVAVIFAIVATRVLVAFSVGVRVAVEVAVGSNVNVAGIGVKVGSSIVAVGMAMMSSTVGGGAGVAAGEQPMSSTLSRSSLTRRMDPRSFPRCYFLRRLPKAARWSLRVRSTGRGSL